VDQIWEGEANVSGKPQPRVPAGSSAGGQFGSGSGGGGGGGGPRTFDNIEKAHEEMAADQSWADDMDEREIEGVHKYTIQVGVNDDLRGGKPPSEDDTVFGAERLPTNEPFLDPKGKQYLDDNGKPMFKTRAGNGITDKESVAALDKAMKHDSAVLKEGVVVHRAWSGSGANKEVGKVFTDKGFTSTAVVKSEIGDFAATYGNNQTTVEIRVPKGARAIYLGKDKSPVERSWDEKKGRLHNRWYAGSTELLLDRGTRYRVISSDKTGGTRARHVVLEVVLP